MAVVPLAEARWPKSGLPDFQPGADGWSDVLLRRSARQRVQRRRQAGVFAGSCALVLAWLVSVPDPAPVSAPAPAHTVAASLPIEAELARLDRALQRAYDRHASAAELAPLWQARAQLAHGLDRRASDPSRLVAL